MVVPVSDAWFSFVDGSVNFATCGIISVAGTVSYLKGEVSGEPEEQRQRDAPKAKTTLDQLLFAHVVDNFQTYLADLILEILNKDPRPIFGKKFQADMIFTVDDLTSLKQQVIQRYILDLGYRSIDELSATIEREFGLKSLRGKMTRHRVNRLIQIRNVITHNRGITNKVFLHRSGSKIDIEGQGVRLFKPLCAAKYLGSLASRIDEEAVRKFGIKGYNGASGD